MRPPGIVLVLLVLPARLPSAAAATATAAVASMLHASLPLSSAVAAAVIVVAAAAAQLKTNNACIFPPFSHKFSVVVFLFSFRCLSSSSAAVATGRVNKSATWPATRYPPLAANCLSARHTVNPLRRTHIVDVSNLLPL